ncbi:MAG: hypothetical protein R3E48_10085 [Burkholderiaceae bacterium]
MIGIVFVSRAARRMDNECPIVAVPRILPAAGRHGERDPESAIL